MAEKCQVRVYTVAKSNQLPINSTLSKMFVKTFLTLNVMPMMYVIRLISCIVHTRIFFCNTPVLVPIEKFNCTGYLTQYISSIRFHYFDGVSTLRRLMPIFFRNFYNDFQSCRQNSCVKSIALEEKKLRSRNTNNQCLAKLEIFS